MPEIIDLKTLLTESMLTWGINIALAMSILLSGYFLTKIAVRLLKKALVRTQMDRMLTRFIVSLLNGLLTLVIAIAALNQLGLDTTSFVALIGAAGLAVGLAMQDALRNFSAGVMLVLFKLFKVDDFIEAEGISGTVEEIQIFNTLLKTPDNRRIHVPNARIYAGTIINYSTHDTRRIDITLDIGYENDIKKTKEVICELLKEDSRILQKPAFEIGVQELADNGIRLFIRPWVKNTNYWAVKTDLLEKIKEAMLAHNITIAYPRRDMYIRNT